MRRVPNIDKLHLLTGFRPQTSSGRNRRPGRHVLSPERRTSGECRQALYGVSRSVTETSLSASDLFWCFL